jgi:hypothetical protein
MAMSRLHSFVVLFPDIARAGPARDQTLIEPDRFFETGR